ncbi:MAG: SIMPL domain-containing protein [Pseudomonadota bacterium]
MQEIDRKVSALILGTFLFLGLTSLGYLLGNSAIEYREYERTVTVKGLSEREYDADIVIWPISFTETSNELESLYVSIEESTSKIKGFLEKSGIKSSEVSYSFPAITDKSAQQYGNNAKAEFRYTARQTVTVYSKNINAVRGVMSSLPELGKEGIVFTGGNYQSQTEYLFTRLNEIKPEMIEEATRKAREVAQKFATDSQSTLGKIKKASQGQFSINPRDKNNPHIKRIRVVSTVEYYLSD